MRPTFQGAGAVKRPGRRAGTGLGSGVAGLLLAVAAAAAEPGDWPTGPGYQAQRGDMRYVYIVPPGFESGRCDRGVAGPFAFGSGSGGGSSDGGSAATVADDTLAAAAAERRLLVGSPIGKIMDALDHGCVIRALEFLPDRAPVVWQNRELKASYQVMAVRTFESHGGQICREYTASATVGGSNYAATGTACREPLGRWVPAP